MKNLVYILFVAIAGIVAILFVLYRKDKKTVFAYGKSEDEIVLEMYKQFRDKVYEVVTYKLIGSNDPNYDNWKAEVLDYSNRVGISYEEAVKEAAKWIFEKRFVNDLHNEAEYRTIPLAWNTENFRNFYSDKQTTNAAEVQRRNSEVMDNKERIKQLFNQI
jgi:hypothetical protein